MQTTIEYPHGGEGTGLTRTIVRPSDAPPPGGSELYLDLRDLATATASIVFVSTEVDGSAGAWPDEPWTLTVLLDDASISAPFVLEVADTDGTLASRQVLLQSADITASVPLEGEYITAGQVAPIDFFGTACVWAFLPAVHA